MLLTLEGDAKAPVHSRRFSRPIGNLIVIEKTGFGSVGFFLLGVLDSVPLVQPLKFVTETCMWNLNEVLIVPFADVNRPLPIRIGSDNQRSDTVFDAVSDNVSNGFVDVIPYPVVALNCQSALEISVTFIS